MDTKTKTNANFSSISITIDSMLEVRFNNGKETRYIEPLDISEDFFFEPSHEQIWSIIEYLFAYGDKSILDDWLECEKIAMGLDLYNNEEIKDFIDKYRPVNNCKKIRIKTLLKEHKDLGGLFAVYGKGEDGKYYLKSANIEEVDEQYTTARFGFCYSDFCLIPMVGGTNSINFAKFLSEDKQLLFIFHNNYNIKDYYDLEELNLE